jgi:hypothetical protein
MIGPVEIGRAVNEIYRGFFWHGMILPSGFLIGNYSVGNKNVELGMKNVVLLFLLFNPLTGS